MSSTNRKLENPLPPLLEVQNIVKNFGGLVAVNHVDFHINQGEILGLIGPNGAGKSTILNIVGGSFSADNGKIIFDNENITRFPNYRRAKKGIARVFQRNALFHSFTVIENVVAGLMLHYKTNAISISKEENMSIHLTDIVREKAVAILQFVGLSKQTNEIASNLPHGKLRALCLAIALAIKPRLLLLDEPLTGMNVEEMAVMMKLIKQLREEMGIGSIIVEHNMKAITGLCDRIVVLNFGRKIAEGLPSTVVQNPVVIQAYLGAEYKCY